jgi:hypothetical protein
MYRLIATILLVLPVTMSNVAFAADRSGDNRFRVPLTGAQEDPSVITSARGIAVLRIVGATVQYNVRYWDLESDIEQAHIHIGARDTTGGVAAFLCSDLAGPPPGTAPCPASPGQLVGVIEASEVIGPVAQGIAPGEIADLQKAIRSGLAYINIHTVVSPAGEIRGDLHQHFWPH